MVLYDDKKWLCRLIRTAFTIDDDSGISEKVLKEKPFLGATGDDSSSNSSEESFAIREGNDHRRRSNTAIRLEKLEKKKKTETQTQNVRFNPVDLARNEITFGEENSYLKKLENRQEKAVSVEKLLKSTPHPDDMPFSRYARFEATGHPTVANKKMAIFLMFLPPKLRAYPLRVSIVSIAKVQDLIGLTLWMVSQIYPDVKLHAVDQYNLQIADEDGEYDAEFPCLDPSEPMSKFSFHHLSLIYNPHVTRNKPTTPKISLKFMIPNGQILNLSLENAEISLKELISIVLERSEWSKKSQVVDPSVYHLERLGNHTAEFNDGNVSLAETKCREFCLVRNGAKSVQAPVVKPEDLGGHSGATPDIIGVRSDIYPVGVSTGRFNKQRSALCVIWGRDRMDLEFQAKIKSYPLSSISSVKFDQSKHKVSITFHPNIAAAVVGSHYLTGANALTLTTADAQIGNELYCRLNSVIASK